MKIGKNGYNAKALALAKLIVGLKTQSYEKRLFKHILVVLGKKPLEKTANFSKSDDFENWAIL